MSAQTIVQKILAAKAGRRQVEVGQFVVAEVDLVMVNDITGPPAFKAFEAAGGKAVFDPQKVVLVPDHFTPNRDIPSAKQCAELRRFAGQSGARYYEVGRLGIAHVLLPEEGLIAPGNLILGADSHTCTYGALNALGIGVGSTDAGTALATGRGWFRVPATVRVELKGCLAGFASAKDLALTLLDILKTDGARYQALEYGGPGLAGLSVEDRLCVANMATETGAKAGLFEADEKTAEFVRAVGASPDGATAPDKGTAYSRVIEVDLGSLTPLVAQPHSPDNVTPVAGLNRVVVDQVVIGSCTNGRLSDLAMAASILKGRQVAGSVRLIILPGSQKVWLEADRLGFLRDLAEAGAAIGPPSCGPCLGGHLGILAEGETCLATTNRNFPGRMGHPLSQVYLASPATAAATAIAGWITSPEEG